MWIKPPEPAFKSDLIKWEYTGIGGEDALPQKQLLNGPVLYTVPEPPRYGKLLAEGHEDSVRV